MVGVVGHWSSVATARRASSTASAVEGDVRMYAFDGFEK